MFGNKLLTKVASHWACVSDHSPITVAIANLITMLNFFRNRDAIKAVKSINLELIVEIVLTTKTTSLGTVDSDRNVFTK